MLAAAVRAEQVPMAVPVHRTSALNTPSAAAASIIFASAGASATAAVDVTI
jgi:hypothetical protein